MINNYSITNIYEKPSRYSKLSSQMLLGEEFKIISKKRGGIQVRASKRPQKALEQLATERGNAMVEERAARERRRGSKRAEKSSLSLASASSD